MTALEAAFSKSYWSTFHECPLPAGPDWGDEMP